MKRNVGDSLPAEIEEGSNSENASESADNASTSTTSDRLSRASTTKGCAIAEITRTETAAVKRHKLLVYFALCVAAAAVGAVTYLLMENEETANYMSDFQNFAREVSRVAESNAKSIMGQVHSSSIMVTSIAKYNNFPWPNMSVPHFARRSLEAQKLTGIEILLFAPIVPSSQKESWESFAWANQDWIELDLSLMDDPPPNPGNISRRIYPYHGVGLMDEIKVQDKEGHRDSVSHDIYVPAWQLGPVPRNASIINLDLYSHPSFHNTINGVLDTKHVIISDVTDLTFLLESTDLDYKIDSNPRSYILHPIFDDFDQEKSSVVGFFVAELKWEAFLVDLLPENADGILLVVEGSCGGNFSYHVNGFEELFLQEGDVHDRKYDGAKQVYQFAEFARYDGDAHASSCNYTFSIYPTDVFVQPYRTNKPAVYASIVVLIFCLTAAVFALYDYMVHMRQKKLLDTAQRTNQIVASMFPKDVQRRMMENATEEARMTGKPIVQDLFSQATSNDGRETSRFKSKPIADLFSEVTVLFADIVGFTAWSSMREPSQVFTLLETIFHEYDEIASRRKVFKVETVGDCYVAVAGLPDPRKDHAVVMARFARDCLYKFQTVVKELEIDLGPDTSDLGMRFGIHSGPVTAGVLRGERARFQLFGDTMNTTARIESTGARNKIHISLETAEQLTAQGKGHWCSPREERVVAKGKGELTTFWLDVRGDSTKSSHSGNSSESGDDPYGATRTLQRSLTKYSSSSPMSCSQAITGTKEPSISERHVRLVGWNKEILVRLLKEKIARRIATGTKPDWASVERLEAAIACNDHTVLDEVKEVVPLAKFDPALKEMDPSAVELPDSVVQQLHDYLTTIANLYRDNSFHNFEHASHVTMSAVKLLSRITTPNIDSGEVKALHDHTFGIASSPLTRLSVILAAIIHDVDHTGVPNTQLVKEQASIASVYKNKSVAEQNSVDIAWDLLMHPQFEDLRHAIYVNDDELGRFRQTLVNAVMATDIMDKDLGAARKERWNRAFAESEAPLAAVATHESEYETHRKATVVVEHLIQASDVAHTMQHWHIYRKWNARLFEEMYKAYQDGRAERDPAESWYVGEIGFFDYYVIPLAQKLKDCGIFGVSGDEYLNYAQQNRREWESKGQQIVADMVEKAQANAS